MTGEENSQRTGGIQAWDESRVRKTLSTVNVCNGMVLFGMSIVLLVVPVIGISASFASVTLLAYLIFLGLVFTCLELRITYFAVKIRRSLGFLFKPFGRGFYLLFVASVALAAGTAGGGTGSVIMWIIGLSTAANAIFNIVVIYYHPYVHIEDIPEDEEVEVNEFGTRNTERMSHPKSVETIAGEMMVDYLRKNPALAKRILKDVVIPNAMRGIHSSVQGSAVNKPGLALLALQQKQREEQQGDGTSRSGSTDLSRASRIKLATGESTSVEDGTASDSVAVDIHTTDVTGEAQEEKGKKRRRWRQRSKKRSEQNKAQRARGPTQGENNASVIRNPFHNAANAQQLPDSSDTNTPDTPGTTNPYALALSSQNSATDPSPDKPSAGVNATVINVANPPPVTSRLVKFTKNESALRRAFARREAQSPEDFYVPAPNSILRNQNASKAPRYRYSFGAGGVVQNTDTDYAPYLAASQHRPDPGTESTDGPVPRQSIADLKWAAKALDGIEYEENIDESGAVNPFL